MSGQALPFGIKDHKIAGTMLRVFCPAKTVADGSKFRNKVGVGVAIEALKESRRTKKATMDEILGCRKSLPGGQRHAPVHGVALSERKMLVGRIRHRSTSIS